VLRLIKGGGETIVASEPHARILRSIWLNEEWLDLSIPAQWLYTRILTSAKVSKAGVAEWRPKVLTQSAIGVSAELLESAALELEETMFLVIDRGTEEVLIRSFVRNDGLLAQPNMATAVAKAYADIGSRRLRGVLNHELHRLQNDQPGLHWDKLAMVMNKPVIDPHSDAPGGLRTAV
jgi:hypothetical protein